MNPYLKPINLNEKSYRVNFLQKVLSVLDFPVNKSEVAQSKAGKSTLKQVRALQSKLGIEADDSTLINEDTIIAINEAMKKRGLLTASRSFTITGAVRYADGTKKKHQQLLAFDLDLRGVAAHGGKKSLSDIQDSGNFDFLGETFSDNIGNFKITFYDWQYRRVERKKAVVAIYALEQDEIIGFTPMINTDDYLKSNLVRNLDVMILRGEKRTEYKILVDKLNTFLEDNKFDFDEISKSTDQLTFIAGELDVDISHIKLVTNIKLLVKEEKQLSQELLYGIGRQNINLDWKVLYKKSEEEIREAISNSVNQGITRSFQEDEITGFIKRINELEIKNILSDQKSNGSNRINVILSYALPEENQRILY